MKSLFELKQAIAVRKSHTLADENRDSVFLLYLIDVLIEHIEVLEEKIGDPE